MSMSDDGPPSHGVELQFPSEIAPLIDPRNVAPLQCVLRRMAEVCGVLNVYFDGVPEAVPDLWNAPAFVNRLNRRWEYVYGLPLSLTGGRSGFGSNNCIAVQKLFDVLAASRRLDFDKRVKYLRRLNDPVKHNDVLTEFVPVLRVPPATQVFFEVKEFGTPGTDIDWRIVPSVGPEILLEQKSRLGILAQELEKQDAALLAGAREMTAPRYDLSKLFKSVQEKFIVCDPTVRLQGAWIHCWLKVDATEIQAAFDALSPDQIHFAVIADWNADVHLLSRASVDRGRLLSNLGVTESDRMLM